MHLDNKAIFIDRDGVINANDKHYYVYKKDQFEFIDGIIDLLQRLTELNYLIIVITNQGGIAKGSYSLKDVEALHKYMCKVLENQKVIIHEIYVCPHYPTFGLCLCRKPNSISIEKALARFNLIKEKCVFIGDSETDMVAAQNAGIRGILVEGNKNCLNNPFIKQLMAENL